MSTLQMVPVVAAPARVIEIPVPMIDRDALFPEGATPNSHRGTWWYDPRLYGVISAGDVVRFTCCGDLLLKVRVTGGAADEQWSSRINSRGFSYEIDQE